MSKIIFYIPFPNIYNNRAIFTRFPRMKTSTLKALDILKFDYPCLIKFPHTRTIFS